MIAARTGRRTLLAVVVLGFATAFLVLVVIGRGGAVSAETFRDVSARLLKLYVPLLGLVASFYFSEHGLRSRRGKATNVETFLLATGLAGAWCLLPGVLIAATDTVENAVRLLDTFEIFGSTMAVSALGFYFSKTSPEAVL